MSNNFISNQQFISDNSSLEKPPKVEEMGVSISDEIDRLEDLILNGNRLPFVGKTLIDEETLINQLDLIRINIPDCLQQASQILQRREQLLSEAQNYAQKIVENAQRRAAQLLDESLIVQQAETQAHQIRRQVQQDCENLQRKTINEVEQVRQKIQLEAINSRQQAILEAEKIQNDVDVYIDTVVSKVEESLYEALRRINREPSVESNKTPQLRQQNMNMNKKAS